MATSGPHEAVKNAVTPEPVKALSHSQTAIQWLTAASLFFVVMTPVIYIMGRAYHDGWYDYLKLDQSMFPLDTAGMLTEGGVALTQGFGELSHWFGGGLRQWLISLLIIIVGGVIWAIFAMLIKDLRSDGAKTKKNPDKHKNSFFRWLVTSALPRIALLALFGFTIYEFIAATALVFLTLTQPFVALGKYEAEKSAAVEFNRSPIVTVKLPQGDVKFREIGCGPQFCALWKDKHASYAPVSMITWGDSPTPDH